MGTTSDSTKTFEAVLQAEVDELGERLQAQHLSPAGVADVDDAAQQELNAIVEDVLVEDIYELAKTSFVLQHANQSAALLFSSTTDSEHTSELEVAEESGTKRKLSSEELEIVETALHGGPMQEILVQKYNVEITRQHLQCLLPPRWLNDEVINFYFQMLSDRDVELVKHGVLAKRSHFFNSFFYTKLSTGGYDFDSVRRWTRKIDLFALDKVLMPVNVSNAHWCMAVIFMTAKRIQYYDSVHDSGTACLHVLLRYLRDEMQHKKQQSLSEQDWQLVPTTTGTPRQTVGGHCGVFSCMFADFIGRNKPLAFTQRDMAFFRRRMALCISRGALPLDEEL